MNKVTFKQTYLLIYLFILTSSLSAQTVLSVLYFENTTARTDYQWLSKGIADMLISDLSDVPGITVTERESLEKILQEQALQLTGITEGAPLEFGKLLQADQLIYGAYIINDDEIRIDMKLAEVESGRIVFTKPVQGEIDDIFELQGQLAQALQKHLQLTDTVMPRQADTPSIQALASYYKGLDHLDHRRYKEAEQQFVQATELDPLFYRAQQGLAESYKFLKAFKKHRQQREIAALYAKIKNLRERLAAPQWMTFADIVQSAQYRAMTIEQQQKWNTEHNEYLICNTPVQCTWHIMLTLDEIARKSADYFNDPDLQQLLWRRMDKIADDSRETYSNDPFLPEILYIQLLAYYSLKDYTQLKTKAEKFLITYPSYRMIETVEDWYETALDNLSDE